MPSELRARAYAELRVCTRQRRLDRVHADGQLRRGLLVRSAVGDERGNTLLRGRQVVAGGSAAADPPQLSARLRGPKRCAELVEDGERLVQCLACVAPP